MTELCVCARTCAPARAKLRRDERNMRLAELWETRKKRNKTRQLNVFYNL
jgi:hypothetical protein